MNGMNGDEAGRCAAAAYGELGSGPPPNRPARQLGTASPSVAALTPGGPDAHLPSLAPGPIDGRHQRPLSVRKRPGGRISTGYAEPSAGLWMQGEDPRADGYPAVGLA